MATKRDIKLDTQKVPMDRIVSWSFNIIGIAVKISTLKTMEVVTKIVAK
jgi:hypothetical protein